MSGNVYPVLPPGRLDWPVVRTTSWSTLTDTAMAGRMATLSLQQYALYTWEFNYCLLRDDTTPSDYKTLTGFFNAMQGRFDSFLYTDPIYNTVVDEPMGVGDATTTKFQIVATYRNAGGPGRADIIQTFNGVPTFKVAGVPTAVGLGPSGVVAFAVPPANGAAITWSGSFYFRCRFLDDALPLDEFMDRWWHTTSPVRIGSILL